MFKLSLFVCGVEKIGWISSIKKPVIDKNSVYGISSRRQCGKFPNPLLSSYTVASTTTMIRFLCKTVSHLTIPHSNWLLRSFILIEKDSSKIFGLRKGSFTNDVMVLRRRESMNLCSDYEHNHEKCCMMGHF